MEALASFVWSARPALVVGFGLAAFVALDLFVRVLRRVGVAVLVATVAFVVMMPDQVPAMLEEMRGWFSPLAPTVPGQRLNQWFPAAWGRG